MRAQDVVWGRDLVLCLGQGYRGHSWGQDSPALAVLVGLKEKETASIKTPLLRGPGGGYKHPEDRPAPLWPCLGEPRGPQGSTRGGVYHEEGVVVLLEVVLELAGLVEQSPALV